MVAVPIEYTVGETSEIAIRIVAVTQIHRVTVVELVHCDDNSTVAIGLFQLFDADKSAWTIGTSCARALFYKHTTLEAATVLSNLGQCEQGRK